MVFDAPRGHRKACGCASSRLEAFLWGLDVQGDYKQWCNHGATAPSSIKTCLTLPFVLLVTLRFSITIFASSAFAMQPTESMQHQIFADKTQTGWVVTRAPFFVMLEHAQIAKNVQSLRRCLVADLNREPCGLCATHEREQPKNPIAGFFHSEFEL